jgi:hypothetical protein
VLDSHRFDRLRSEVRPDAERCFSWMPELLIDPPISTLAIPRTEESPHPSIPHFYQFQFLLLDKVPFFIFSVVSCRFNDSSFIPWTSGDDINICFQETNSR